MKTSRAECGAVCRVDRLSAGLIGRLGVTFNVRLSEQIDHGLKRSDVVILNTEYKSHTRVKHSKKKGLNNVKTQS